MLRNRSRLDLNPPARRRRIQRSLLGLKAASQVSFLPPEALMRLIISWRYKNESAKAHLPWPVFSSFGPITSRKTQVTSLSELVFGYLELI
jgi:hypothetical protein